MFTARRGTDSALADVSLEQENLVNNITIMLLLLMMMMILMVLMD